MSETKYSELAQNTAKDVLKAKVLNPRLVILSMLPFMEADDIPGCNLVMKCWMRGGANLVELAKFARDNKKDEVIAPVLDWFRDNLLPHKGEPKFDMTKEDLRAGAWINALD